MNRLFQNNPAKPLIFSGTAQALGIARFVVYSLWFYWIASADLARLAQLPEVAYTSTGILRVLGKGLIPVTPEIIVGFKLVLCSVLGVLALGIRPFTPFAWCAVVGIVLFESWVKSFSSFVNHRQLGMLYAAVILALFPASDGCALFRFQKPKAVDQAIYASAMAFIVFACSMAYAFVGARRLAAGPEVLWDDSLPMWVLERTLDPLGFGMDWGLFFVKSPALLILMKFGFALTTLFEILSPLVLFSDRFRRVWLLVIVPFHFMTLVTMNIFFWENLILIMTFFTGLTYQFIPWLISRFSHKPGVTSTAELAIGDD